MSYRNPREMHFYLIGMMRKLNLMIYSYLVDEDSGSDPLPSGSISLDDSYEP